jgi:hypothetical protein
MPPAPKRTVAELKELRALTGDENGAQRVAFTPTVVYDPNYCGKVSAKTHQNESRLQFV